jgi:uncharacterized protein YbgA (DUF1722 family)/uncharacterized protein YbbK (DUF523 family)
LKNTSLSSFDRVRVGISSCLLGQRVRFDGGHKRDSFLADVFARYVEWVPVCPEVELGLGTPRETLRLVNNDGVVRLIASSTGADHTEAMREWAEHRIDQLAKLGLCGYVFKRGSPTCGVERVKVYRRTGLLHRNGAGVFSAAVAEQLRNLPIEEEGRLNDARLRENFVSSVFSYKRWLDLAKTGITPASLMQFHARHKFLLMAHSQLAARRLGTLAARGAEYFTVFCEIMRLTPTRRNHTNVLQHLFGYFSERLDDTDRAELTLLIESYRLGTVPLIVPVTLIRHYVRKFEIAYLKDQVYLDPHPHELMLLNYL